MPLTEQFLTYLAEQRGLAPNTIATYRRTYRSFHGIEAATHLEVEAWWAARAHLSPATRVNELAAVRSFYAWCRRWGHTAATDDPTYRIEPPKVPKGVPRPVSRSDLRLLLANCEGEMRRAIALGAYAGLRVSEAAALQWADVDRETNRIRVLGKGQKTRLVGLSPMLLDALLPDTGGNVVTGGQAPASAGNLQRRVNRAIRAAGVDATFHQLRHRFGTVALARTGNLVAVSRAMGHASLATTAIYTASADADLDLIAAAVAE